MTVYVVDDRCRLPVHADVLFSAPECTLTVAVEGETILFPCYQAKIDAKQTKQKTPLVSSEP